MTDSKIMTLSVKMKKWQKMLKSSPPSVLKTQFKEIIFLIYFSHICRVLGRGEKAEKNKLLI